MIFLLSLNAYYFQIHGFLFVHDFSGSLIFFVSRFITFNIVEDHNVSSVGARTSLANSAGAYNLLRAAGESVGLDLSSAHGATDVLIALLDNEVQCNPSFHRRIITDSP